MEPTETTLSQLPSLKELRDQVAQMPYSEAVAYLRESRETLLEMPCQDSDWQVYHYGLNDLLLEVSNQIKHAVLDWAKTQDSPDALKQVQALKEQQWSEYRRLIELYRRG